MKTSIAILGSEGRMGRMIEQLATARDDVEVAALIDKDSDPAAASAADVVIDFTFHTAVVENIARAVANKQAFVLGTTGLDESERAAVEEAAKVIPVVWAPNFSLGINVLLDLVRRAAAVLDENYDIEIVEMHHRHKQDAPSGTALALATAAAAGRNSDSPFVFGREGIVGERPKGEIALHALRGGDVVGDHTVMFAADGERVEITHKASSRACFANGAIEAAVWLGREKREPKIYSMRDVLGLK